MGPRTCGSNLRATGNSWCSTTLHPLLQNWPFIGTCLQSPYIFYAPSQDWPWPFPTSAAFLHQVVWPWILPHSHHLEVAQPKLWAQLVTCPSPFERGWPPLPNALNCCNKTQPTPNGPPNLVAHMGPSPHNSLGIVGSSSSPSWFVHPFGIGMRCLSWAPTPCASTRLSKSCLWTLGLSSTECPLGGHDAWTHGWRTTFPSLGPWHFPLWEWNVPSC